jgi:hypothetical protein
MGTLPGFPSHRSRKDPEAERAMDASARPLACGRRGAAPAQARRPRAKRAWWQVWQGREGRAAALPKEIQLLLRDYLVVGYRFLFSKVRIWKRAEPASGPLGRSST